MKNCDQENLQPILSIDETIEELRRLRKEIEGSLGGTTARPDHLVPLPTWPDHPKFVVGYQPNINCIHFYRGRCAHPSAKRLILPNKRCVLASGADVRCDRCRYQVESEPLAPPPAPSVRPAKSPGADHD